MDTFANSPRLQNFSMQSPLSIKVSKQNARNNSMLEPTYSCLSSGKPLYATRKVISPSVKFRNTQRPHTREYRADSIYNVKKGPGYFVQNMA